MLNPQEMERRITLDNIEHVESVTINGQAFVKIYLHPNASLDSRATSDAALASYDSMVEN